MLSRVLKKHAELGGIPSTANPNSQIKKALSTMAEAGEIERLPNHGYWRYLGAGTESEKVSISESIIDVADVDEDEPYQVENFSGAGRSSVYIYYFPTYRRGENPFPMKIGMSTISYQARIASQLGTSNPELPFIYRIHHTDAPVMVERFLHSALTLKGRWMADAPGTEWFMTTPDEIDDLLRAAGQFTDPHDV